MVVGRLGHPDQAALAATALLQLGKGRPGDQAYARALGNVAQARDALGQAKEHMHPGPDRVVEGHVEPRTGRAALRVEERPSSVHRTGTRREGSAGTEQLGERALALLVDRDEKDVTRREARGSSPDARLRGPTLELAHARPQASGGLARHPMGWMVAVAASAHGEGVLPASHQLVERPTCLG